jgi:hypothetical protein
MITRQQWEANDSAKLELEKFLGTTAGVMLMDVLAGLMISDKPQSPYSASLIEATAISGAEDNGYRRCYQNILSLTDLFIRQKQDRQKQNEVQRIPGTTLPIRQDIVDRIDSDPIYAGRLGKEPIK